MGLETFPLLDAFQQSGGCPFCRLAESLEQGFVQEYLDELVMDFEFRQRIEDFGLCARHLKIFHSGTDKLGLALTLQSMLSTVRREVDGLKKGHSPGNWIGNVLQMLKQRQLRRHPEDALNGPLAAGAVTGAISRFETYVRGEKCTACASVSAGVERYAATAVEAFARDPGFRRAYEGSPGLCLPHSGLLIRTARISLRGSDLAAFLNVTIAKMERDLDKVGSALARFIQAHDYRYSDQPWEPFASAVRDAVALFAGSPAPGREPESNSKPMGPGTGLKPAKVPPKNPENDS